MSPVGDEKCRTAVVYSNGVKSFGEGFNQVAGLVSDSTKQFVNTWKVI